MAFVSLDTAALISTSLEGILYGEYLNQFVHLVTTKLRIFRPFGPYVYRHHVGNDLQTFHARCQSPSRCCIRPTVDIEYRSEPLASVIKCHSLKHFFQHIILGIMRMEYGLVTYRDTFPGGPAGYFADVSQETYLIKNSIYVLQTLLGDAVAVSSTFYLRV